jgi:Uma2 family endonuclease
MEPPAARFFSMSIVPDQLPAGECVPTADQRIVMRASWEQYEALLDLRGDVAGPRMAYLDGVVELMSRSKDHEKIKSYIGMLIEAYALERGIELSPYGGWLQKAADKKAGVEPDECYLVGEDQDRGRPDLAIEVVWTSGGIRKLEIYQRLNVREVWYWKKGVLQIHVLRDGRYGRTDASEVFPGLDLALLCSFLTAPTATQAVKGYRAALAGK